MLCRQDMGELPPEVRCREAIDVGDEVMVWELACVDKGWDLERGRTGGASLKCCTSARLQRAGSTFVKSVRQGFASTRLGSIGPGKCGVRGVNRTSPLSVMDLPQPSIHLCPGSLAGLASPLSDLRSSETIGRRNLPVKSRFCTFPSHSRLHYDTLTSSKG